MFYALAGIIHQKLSVCHALGLYEKVQIHPWLYNSPPPSYEVCLFAFLAPSQFSHSISSARLGSLVKGRQGSSHPSARNKLLTKQPVLESRVLWFLYRRNGSDMKQALVTYLFRSNGHVSELPTVELLSSLEHLRPAGIAQETNASADNEAISAFFQTLKRTMRTGGTSVKRNFGEASSHTSCGEPENVATFSELIPARFEFGSPTLPFETLLSRVCEIGLLTCCTCPVLKLYKRLAPALFKHHIVFLSTPVFSLSFIHTSEQANNHRKWYWW